MVVKRLEIPLAKAEYLFSHSAEPGKGGDKRKFWQEILGFDSARAVREAILAKVGLDQLEAIEPNSYGNRYQPIIAIKGLSDKVRYLKTIWIVLIGETIARFVTAVPASVRR